MIKPLLAVVCCAILSLIASASTAADKVDFAHDVLPVLKARCAKCHTNGTYKGDLSLDTRETLIASEVVAPGNSAKSELMRRITAVDAGERMPQEGEPLSAKEIAILRVWIDQGLTWQPGFSFKKAKYLAPLRLRAVELPPVRDGLTNPIDRLLEEYYGRQKTERPRQASETAYLRRVYLDVIGLLPTPAELASFLSDTDGNKREAVARQLLERKRPYAEHWLTFWNDLLRNDYAGTGYIDGGRKPITSWLYRSLLENKPYDQFVRELISPTAESDGFIRGIKWRGDVNASQVVELQFAQNVAQVMLGINLKCASCHDSFIDDWKLNDAYGLAAVVADAPLQLHRCDKPLGTTAQAKFLFPELGALDAKAAKAERLRQLAALMTSKDNGRLARTIVNRLWQRLMGRGLVEPVDVMSNEPWHESLLDYLANHLVENKYDLKKTIELIVTSRACQAEAAVASEEATSQYVFRGPLPKRMTAEQFMDAVWRITRTTPAKPAVDFGDRGGEPVRAALVNADALMRSLGRPNREQVVTTRPDQLTTLQALDLSNGQVLADLLARGAANVRRAQPKATTPELVEGLYRAALSRAPSKQELAAAAEVVGTPTTDEGIADLLWIIFMLPEFQLIR